MDSVNTIPIQKAPTPQTPAQKQAMKSATEFEAFFIYQTLQLSQPKTENEIFNGGFAEDMMRQTLNEEVGKAIAKQGGFGIADTVYTQLIKMQETNQ